MVNAYIVDIQGIGFSSSRSLQSSGIFRILLVLSRVALHNPMRCNVSNPVMISAAFRGYRTINTRNAQGRTSLILGKFILCLALVENIFKSSNTIYCCVLNYTTIKDCKAVRI